MKTGATAFCALTFIIGLHGRDQLKLYKLLILSVWDQAIAYYAPEYRLSKKRWDFPTSRHCKVI
jgi:hypothetical protein